MNAPKNTIKINNKIYDISPRKDIDPNKALQDLIREENEPPKIPVALTVKPTLPKPQPKQKRSFRHISDVKHVSRKTEKSQTLMRPAVKKPDVKPAPKRRKEEVPRVLPINKGRLARAKSVQKSSHIKKFARPAIRQAVIRPKLQNISVKHPAPAAVLPLPPAPRENNWPVIDQFERAVQEASSHLETFAEETARSKKGRKLAYVFASLAVVLVIGFGVYHELPNAQIKLAGNKAGFSPAVPTYSPSGYGLTAPVKADYGEVTLSYKSHTDDKIFNIVQEPSQWSSQSLVDNFLASAHKDYKTVKGNGRTIYTYGGSDATWVDGGIWYKVEGNANLSNDQLLKIANSL